ncbi:P-loop containing nucleoside triphosphate hydrolase protein [Jimgerdemannia flammicorona]|uniref:P-loop containing nucleoside triphosphate hydrolase protein n=1 Tax=Jimgerdemannia flammicorona TaxID=994334 RepID=A0A433DD18_9FUNG|nr:P-loop containing nucleoside triphosphate hydrolase protein [Jimgerdemannia flammicorona]
MVDANALTKALTARVVETQRGGRRGELIVKMYEHDIYDVPLNVVQATAVRDALSKAIYNNLFEWIVDRVNVSLKQRSASDHVIGVLDIYGFEIFDENNFEQLCINYVNEKLQQIFIELTLKTEQEEYIREKIKWTPIEFFNNKIVCDLIEEKRPPGIIAALNDACATAHADSSAADNSFVQRLGFLSSNPHFESRGSKFLVRHYAGDVLYNIEGMTDKNKDQLLKDLLDLVASSSNTFLATLFPERVDRDSKKRPPTAGDKIKASCNALVQKLMQCHPSYIRTIKPNDNRSSSEYDQKRVLHQIKYLGLCENIRTFEKFVERFYLLSPKTGYAGDYIWNGDIKTAVTHILNDCNIAKDEWQLGTSKAFIRHPETMGYFLTSDDTLSQIFALEHLRDRYWHNMAIRIQRAWRNYLRYRIECARRIQRAWRRNKDQIGYLQLREYGHQVLGGRKERRRFSLLSMRRFTGDYLGVKGDSIEGKMLRDACNLKGGETTVFSGKIQLLVPRHMRASKPSPRSVVLVCVFLLNFLKSRYLYHGPHHLYLLSLGIPLIQTDQNIHIVMVTLNSKVLTMTLERTISLNVIQSVSLSNLRDDWIVLHINSPNDVDAVISSYFKTELVTHLLQRTGGRIGVIISDSIDYTKKGPKKATLKFAKDEKVKKDDVYKSHVINVATGEPANSGRNCGFCQCNWVKLFSSDGTFFNIASFSFPPFLPPLLSSASYPPCKRKPVEPKPITSGKLLKKGGPSKKPVTNAAPRPRPVPAATNDTPASSSSAKARAPPPPPPAPPAPPAPRAAPAVPVYKTIYPFQGQESGEISFDTDEIIEIIEKDENGWWLARKDGKEGWVPSNYLEEVKTAPPPPAPPAPPARRAPPAAPGAGAASRTNTTSGKIGGGVNVFGNAVSFPIIVTSLPALNELIINMFLPTFNHI